MSEFRTALEQLMAGTLGVDDARARIAAAAAREPQVAGAMLAVIESYRAAGRLSASLAAEFQDVVRQATVAPVDSSPVTRLTVNTPGAASPVPPPIPPPIPPPVPPPIPQPPVSAPRSAPRSTRTGGGGGPVLTPGSVLKDRFVLESLVAGGDKGGMGVVFKALDRIKEEAQDRNPYVAIKLLNEDFKQHPDSMMALQREARRAQTLAHPNIITVYDFDRDGDTFFMAMELLNGSPLDKVIRENRDKGGLPVAEAMRIIVQLARGLSHAHANHIVHSDFKPGNAFLTNEGVVKVLDFGIARAVKQADSEKTRFDAGSLGAMTLPYASCEQFERQDPDPSDDVYALAIVSYELLSGHHPFERPDPANPTRLVRTDAVAARNAKMKPAPAPIPGLSRQQWRTLQKGLAFRRADRLRDAGEFLEGMTPRRGQAKTVIAAAVVTVALLITSGMLISSYMHRSRLQALTQRLQSGDPAIIAAALHDLQQYPPAERAPVLLSDGVEASLINYYIARAHQQFNLDTGQYDYAAAMATLKEAQSLSRAYEDSRQLDEATDRLATDRKAAIAREADAFESELSQGLLIASQGAQNVRSTLSVIRQLDAQHPLLSDRRLPIAYATQVRANLDGNRLAIASVLLSAGLQFAPKDMELLDLQDRINRQQNAAQVSVQTGELEHAVQPLTQAGATIADFRAGRSKLDELRRSQPNSSVLLSAQEQLGRSIDPLVASGVAQHQVDEARRTVDEFADLLPSAVLARERMQIDGVSSQAQANADASTALRSKIEQELSAQKSDDSWVNTLQRDLQSLAALAGADDQSIAAARSRAAKGFLESSKQMLASQRFSEAQRDLDLARQFDLPADSYQQQASAITQARAQREADDRARQSSAELAAAKQRVLDQALADHIDVARTQFAELQRKLPADDPFVTTDAPRAIADAYLVRARRAAAQGHFDDAYSQAQAAQAAAPGIAQVASVFQRFQSARELAQQLNTVGDFGALRPQLDRLREAERAEGYHAVQTGMTRVVSERLARLESQDPARARRVRASAAPLFPNLSRETDNASVAPAATGSGQVAVSQPQAQPPPPAATEPEVAPPPLTASEAPPAATGRTPTNVPTRRTPTTAPTPNPAISPTAGGAAVKNPASAASQAAAAAASAPAAGPCSAVNAGSPAGTACRDDLGKAGRGPEMMVIPAGWDSSVFAMMRNETSIADYNVYCAGVAGCSRAAGDNPALPVSTISEIDAEKYAAWLSSTTGARYRLPTDSEWKRAAGNVHDNDANCVVAGASRGESLRAASLGTPNEFGLRNVNGNVQEWVKPAAGGLKALGGAIGDPIEICQTAFSRTHNGQPDGRTGFRLLREIH
jgi:serine/threonine protein kinase/outer membrane biosynthesis protein TonB